VLKEEIKRILASIPERHEAPSRRVPSAVLIPLFEKEGQYHVVLIKRSQTVNQHRGEISFPGGRVEKQDRDLLDTALRESQEEIGIDPADVEVLGYLGDEVTITSNYVVTPYVGIIPWPHKFVIDEREVDYVLEVPIESLMDDARKTVRTQVVDGQPIEVYTYDYQGKIIWGATARILSIFLGIYRRAAAIDLT